MKNIGETLARKGFESPGVQKSWQVHVVAFGPILEPAFVDDYKARIELTAALNHIGKRDFKKGMSELQALQKICAGDADRAACLFCMGLCFEMAGMKEKMLACYQEAGTYGHRFYLPYMKIAKAAHNDAVFEMAEENYRKAIQCLLEAEPDEKGKVLLGSAYTNYASCLTMMHRYGEAEAALRKSADILPEQRGREAAEAILAAAEDDAEKAHKYLNMLAKQDLSIYKATEEMVELILGKKHPQFNRVALEDGIVDAFWSWFVSNENILLQAIEKKDYDTAVQMIAPKLKEVFPFMRRDLEFGIEPKGDLYEITFADLFMIGLENGYRELLEAAPRELLARWRFSIARQ